MEVITTIIPVFTVILLGWGARRRGFITADFLDPANRLVYFLSIPALIFGAIAKTSFHQNFNGKVVSLTLLVIISVYLLSLVCSRIGRMNESLSGSFILCSAHSNVGYIGLPIAYYYFNSDDFAVAGIICGFIMITQNFLSVVFLQMQDAALRRLSSWRRIVRTLAGNPVIAGGVTGMLVSIFDIRLPAVIWRIVEILGGLAPPMALLLIGASLSMKMARNALPATFAALFTKLILLPAAAVLLFQLFHVKPSDYFPAIVLLCSPAATIIYIMVKGMEGDADFAVTQISLGTLLSALTYFLWLAAISSLAGPR